MATWRATRRKSETPHLGEFTKRTHANLSAEGDLHTPKLHATHHEAGGADPISELGNIDLASRYSLLNFPVFLRQRTGQTLTSNLVVEEANRAITLDNLRSYPFIIPQRCNITRIGVRVTTGAAGAQIRVGIYDDDGNLYPDALIVDGGIVSGVGAAIVLATVDVNLNPGIYHLVDIVDRNGVTMACPNPANQISPVWDPQVGSGGWLAAYTFAALPATFPAGGSLDADVPSPKLRIASWLT